MLKLNRVFPMLPLVAVFGLMLTACTPAITPTPKLTEAMIDAPNVVITDVPTETLTQAVSDLGTVDNPIVMLFIPSSDSQEVLAGAEEIGSKVATITGYTFKIKVVMEDTGLINAMCSGEAQVGALKTFSYVLAHQQGCANVALSSIRDGSAFYTAQIITRADSGIKDVEDLKGKTFCRRDLRSTPGWIIPMLSMKAAGLDVDTDLKDVIDVGGHDAVVEAVYKGDCDAGGTFSDARTLVQEDLPDVMEKVVVIEKSGPIPNDNISFAAAIPEDMKQKIMDAFLEIARDPANADLLNNVYHWEGLEKVDDSFYDPFRQQLNAAGLDITDMMRTP